MPSKQDRTQARVSKKKVAKKKVTKKKAAAKKKVATKKAAVKRTVTKKAAPAKKAAPRKKVAGGVAAKPAQGKRITYAEYRERVAMAAYYIAEKRLFENGLPHEDWLAGESEVKAALAREGISVE